MSDRNVPIKLTKIYIETFLMTKVFQLSTSLNSKSLAVLNGYIFVPFKHTPVPIIMFY